MTDYGMKQHLAVVRANKKLSLMARFSHTSRVHVFNEKQFEINFQTRRENGPYLASSIMELWKQCRWCGLISWLKRDWQLYKNQ